MAVEATRKGGGRTGVPRGRRRVMSVRVRFAPSPTGYLHVGGLRTALYNYLFARKHGGTFVLRVEDTDRKRFVEDAMKRLIASMRWAGIDYDEGPGKEGEVGPYTQSERLALYRDAAEQLVKAGKAYYAFDTPEEVEAMRQIQEDQQLPHTFYDRAAMKNSLSCDAAQVQAWIAEGVPYVVRLKAPEDPNKQYILQDLVHGEVVFASDSVDDQVLLKADGFPTYHLANVVDDHAMKITHVIRGEEWLPSAPKHLLLYESFGWEPPKMAHLPLLLNSDGTKMSKRKTIGAFQVDVMVEDYRDKGYLPEALINFLSLLGWNPGTGQELFTLAGLVEAFSLERAQKAGASFDIEKLQWMNKQHLKMLELTDLAQRLKPAVIASGMPMPSDEALAVIAGLMRERVTFLEEIPTQADYLFRDPTVYDEGVVKKQWKGDAFAKMVALQSQLSGLSVWERDAIDQAIVQAAEGMGLKKGAFLAIMRLAVSGAAGGPDLLDMMALLGQETCLRRVARALEALPPMV